MKYHKLVRNKIPEIIRKEGREPVTHIANDSEYWTELRRKLQEEVDEFLKDENQEELADILEVIEAIWMFKGFTLDDILEIKEKKARERGGFTERIILEEA